ncbi:hypothetical protein MMC22_008443 [Lobaria immixta]|nr:hypothetical protein [Lobaria immixta]
MEPASSERKTKRKSRRTVVLLDTQNDDHKPNRDSKAQTSGSKQVLNPRRKSLPNRHTRTPRSSTQWVTIEPRDVEIDSTVLPPNPEGFSEFSDPAARGSTRYRLQRSSKASSINPGSQIVWWQKDESKSTKYRLSSTEAPVRKRRNRPVAGAQLRRSLWRNSLSGIFAVLALYLICNPVLNYVCKDPNSFGLCHEDRYPRAPITRLFDDHFNQKINSVNEKFVEIQFNHKNISDFYFSLANSTAAVQVLRTRVEHSTIAPRERILLGLNQYIANAKINGKVQVVLRAFLASFSNNKERIELYTKKVFEAVGYLKEPPALDSNRPALWIMIFWPFWLPLDHFSKPFVSPLYLAAQHFQHFVASTKPRADKALKLARNLQSTLLEQIGHLDSLFTNPNVVNTTARTSGTIEASTKSGNKVKTSKSEVAIVSRPTRRLSRLWVQTGGEEKDKVSEALDWTDRILPQIVDKIQDTIQSLNEIAVLLDEIETYTNNLRDAA